MTGRYDDLSQEMWNSADDNIPKEYLDAIVAQTMPRKRPLPKTDADLDGSDKLKAIEGRLSGRKLPRFGQPSFDAPLVEWYIEYRYREANPFWIQKEYHWTEDGKEIHAWRN